MNKSASNPIIALPANISYLGFKDYQAVWNEMRNFNEQRDASTTDEIWLLQHPPVFTLGLNGKAEHILDTHELPVIQCDRGGQVTYHGPGQIVAYILLDLQRRHWGVKKLVYQIEQVIIDVLKEYCIDAQRKQNAPGVYVDGAKIAALGLRVRRGCSYHGLSLNVDMDLTPFSYINPCGFEGLTSTQMKAFCPEIDTLQLIQCLAEHLSRQLLEQVSKE